jgi:hypothetical protein
MPNYPSSFDSTGAAPGQRSISNVTSRQELMYKLAPSAGTVGGSGITVITYTALPNSPRLVGSTLTQAAVGTTLVVDGVSLLSLNDRVLVKNWSGTGASFTNGIWQVTTVGASGTSWVLTRDTNWDADNDFRKYTSFKASLGTTNANTIWYLDSDEPITVGTTNVLFTQTPTTITLNSQAKYYTDTNVGIERIGVLNSSYNTDFLTDFKAILRYLDADLTTIQSSITSASTEGLKWMTSAYGISMFNLQSKMEKISYELNRLREDIDRMNTVGFNATFPGMGLTSRYPSGKNRLTNSAGGY